MEDSPIQTKASSSIGLFDLPVSVFFVSIYIHLMPIYVATLCITIATLNLELLISYLCVYTW